MSKVCT